jgi:hypothetical protein
MQSAVSGLGLRQAGAPAGPSGPAKGKIVRVNPVMRIVWSCLGSEPTIPVDRLRCRKGRKPSGCVYSSSFLSSLPSSQSLFVITQTGSLRSRLTARLSTEVMTTLHARTGRGREGSAAPKLSKERRQRRRWKFCGNIGLLSLTLHSVRTRLSRRDVFWHNLVMAKS